MLRALAFLVALFGFVGSGWATSVPLNIEQMLKKAQEPKMPYVPARAGWNGPEERQTTAATNPEYQKLLDQSSPATVRAALRRSAWPHWSVAAMIGLLIFTLRVLRLTPAMEIENSRQATTGLTLVPTRQPVSDGNVIPAREAA